MRTNLLKLTGLALVLATLGSGWVHGRMIHRWGQASALREASERLAPGLPSQLGSWRLVKTFEQQREVAAILRSAAWLHGIYTHDQTGETVVVALVAGPSGPISVHTPEICYSAADYEIAGQRMAITVNDASGQRNTLWQLYANSRHATRPNLRVIYGWSQGDRWEATSGPRFAFAGLPVLYKLQLAGPPEGNQTDAATDPCQDFLSRLLAHLRPMLVASSRNTPLAN